ncbi:MAG: tail fiber assembly protein [Glaciimonas sp.]|nr:tail fiber assembly protein [Glaciimonas sp.]
MTTRFSKATGCFYPFDIYYIDVPDDTVIVSLDDYSKVMNRPNGYTFDFVDDALKISPPPPPTDKQLAESVLQKCTDLKAEATTFIDPLQDAVDFGDATPEEIVLLDKLKLFRLEVSRVPKQKGFPRQIIWPEKPG